MIGMDFISFLILLIISVVVSAILHYGLEYYVTPGFWSFCSSRVTPPTGPAPSVAAAVKPFSAHAAHPRC